MADDRAVQGDVVIRRAHADDAETLADLGRRLFEQTFGPSNTPEDMRAYLAGAFSPEIQRAELADDARAAWLVEDASGRKRLGYAMLRRGSASSGVRAARPCEVQRIYVDAALHGAKVGERLMQACVEQARAWGCDAIWLAVWERNPRAIAFYEKQGFARAGVQTFQLGTDLQHDLVMARFLSS